MTLEELRDVLAQLDLPPATPVQVLAPAGTTDVHNVFAGTDRVRIADVGNVFAGTAGVLLTLMAPA